MLHRVLGPLVSYTKFYLRDSGHFLERLDSLNIQDGDDVILVTFDVPSLYTSIPHSEGIKACEWLLRRSEQYGDIQINFFLELLEIILRMNYFVFQDIFYLQLRGTAMGLNVAPSYANTFMAWLEELHIYRDDLYQKHCGAWYIDDVFVVWRVQNVREIAYLDVMVYREEGIQTKLFSKPTDRNQIEHFRSNHPIHTKEAIPVSQLTRVQRLVSNPEIRKSQIQQMRSKCKKRGFLSRVLDRAEKSVAQNRERKKNKSLRVTFVTQYDESSKVTNEILRKHWYLLRRAYPMVDEFALPPLISYRRGKTIGSQVTKSYVQNETGLRETYVGTRNCGMYPCLNCKQCHYVIKGKFFEHPGTKERYYMRGYYTCISQYAIYAIVCPCGKIYVGETIQKVKSRISQHRSTINVGNAALPLCKHFKYMVHTA
ncbi:hypothetical protein XELAEV_18024746mg [Xenopus laevis]|uniref:GIY-YIG domain-containing protein n=1 Tax=Xenopus laevis TaxID=8355 RepID=A0A974D119_XENLA|nr:hypothetical protein XELAEV_18024746mg [Xenopus laevis]